MNYKKIFLGAGAVVCAASVGAVDRAQEREKAREANKTGLAANYAPLRSWGVYVTGEALIFKPQQPGREFTVNVNKAAYDADQRSVLNAYGVSPCNNYDPGFRVGIGYTLPKHEEWDIYSYYTQFDTKSYQNVLPANGLTPTAPLINYGILAGQGATQATGCWKLHFKTADLELAREFFVGSLVHVRPHFGIRGARITEDLVATYSGVQPNVRVPDFSADTVNEFNSFYGVGAQFGVNTQWHMGTICHNGFSLYGDAAWALLTGKMKLCVNEVANDIQVVQAVDKFSALIGAQTIALGLRWDRTFGHDRVHARISVGWEQQLYMNMWNFAPRTVASAGYNSSSMLSNGNLGLSGWVVGARLDF